MYTAHLSSALAMERQRTLSEESAAAHAVRQARHARRKHRSNAITRLLAALKSRTVPAKLIDVEAAALPGPAPYSAPGR